MSNFIARELSPFLTRHSFITQILGLKKVWVVDYKSIRIEDLDYNKALNRMFSASRLFSIVPLDELAEVILERSNMYILYKRKPNPEIIRL